MFRSLLLLCCAAACASAETYSLTLKQAVARALAQNPEVVMARLDEQKAAQGIRLARDPFIPRLDVGSGLAYTDGFPQSVEGAAPSVVNAKANEFIFNKQQTYLLAQARENARGAQWVTAAKRDDIAFRTASLYLDVQRAAQLRSISEKQVESFVSVEQTAKARVDAGYELPLEDKRATVEVKRAQQRYETVQDDLDYGERSLAIILGYTAEDKVIPVDEEMLQADVVETEEAALAAAVTANKDLRRLESAMIAKGLDAKAAKAQRLPRVDLVAEYALFSTFNHLNEYYQKFQKNNTELGVAISVPLLPGPAISAQVNQALEDTAKLRAEYNSTKNQIELNIHQQYQQLRKVQTAKELADADLDYAREALSVVMSQMKEGRASLRQLEEARVVENEKWLAFYDAQFAAERARLALLKETGALIAALR